MVGYADSPYVDDAWIYDNTPPEAELVAAKKVGDKLDAIPVKWQNTIDERKNYQGGEQAPAKRHAKVDYKGGDVGGEEADDGEGGRLYRGVQGNVPERDPGILEDGRGGQVAAAAPLPGDMPWERAAKSAVSDKTRLAIEEKFGINYLREFLQAEHIYGGEHQALTEAEARILLRAGSIDAARNRIIEAGFDFLRETQPGLFSETLPPPSAQARLARGIPLEQPSIPVTEAMRESVPEGQPLSRPHPICLDKLSTTATIQYGDYEFKWGL